MHKRWINRNTDKLKQRLKMVNYNTVSIFIKIQKYVGIPVDIVFVSLSLLWAVYFLNKIATCFRLSKTHLLEGNPDSARKYKCDMVKYVFLLLINITECGYIQLYWIGSLIPSEHLYWIRPMLPQCSTELIHAHFFDINLILENPLKAFLIALGQVGLLFNLAFLTCLMHYLHIIFHSIPLNPFTFIRHFFSFTSILSLFLVIAGTVPQLILFAKLVEPLVELAYFLIWCKYSLRFYQTLKWRTREFSMRKPYLVKESVKNCRQFAVVMCCMGLGTFLLVVVNFIIQYLFLIAVVLFYGPCLFNYLYGTPYYLPPLVSDRQIETLLYSYTIKVYVTTVIIGIAIFITFSQFFAASVVYFKMILSEKLRMRYTRKFDTKSIPSLRRHLLKYQK